MPSLNSGREALKRGEGNAERLQSLVGQRHGDPRLRRPIGRGLSGSDQRMESSHQLPPCFAVVDANEKIGRHVGGRAFVG